MEAPQRGRRPIQRGTRQAWQAPTTAWAPHSSPTRALARPPAASRAPRYHAGDDHGPIKPKAIVAARRSPRAPPRSPRLRSREAPPPQRWFFPTGRVVTPTSPVRLVLLQRVMRLPRALAGDRAGAGAARRLRRGGGRRDRELGRRGEHGLVERAARMRRANRDHRRGGPARDRRRDVVAGHRSL